ncbi:MAG TPA: universal stress protein [Candidatus Binatus sp.]|nr:universal stress protein [Candidatus Binatus sp.]
MKEIRKILAPTDFSDLSCVGLRRALENAREVGAEVIVLHVVAMSDDWFSKHQELNPVRNLIAEQQAVLDKFLRDKFTDWMNLVEVTQKVELGTPYANIVACAEREGVDIIMMSSHGRSGWDHLLLGSVTEKVIAHAPCPVLAIPVIKPDRALAKAA